MRPWPPRWPWRTAGSSTGGNDYADWRVPALPGRPRSDRHRARRAAAGRGRRVHVRLDQQHLRARRADHAGRGGQPGARDRGGHRRGADLPAAPGRPGPAGADHGGGHRRAAHAGRRPVPPDPDRGHVRLLVRPAGRAHPGVPVDPPPAAARRAGVVHRPAAQRAHRADHPGPGAGPACCWPRWGRGCSGWPGSWPRAPCCG